MKLSEVTGTAPRLKLSQVTGAAQAQPEPPAPEPSFFDKLRGAGEAAASMASGIVAEPFAGVAGIAQALNPLASQGAGGRAVEAVRGAMSYQPHTDTGQQYLHNVGQVVAPVAEAIGGAENYLGDHAYEATGSPALAAAAKTVPTALMEVMGLGGAKYASRAGKTAKEMDQFMAASAPDAERLKDVSRAVYKEIDDMGVKVKADAYSSLAQPYCQRHKKVRA